jgi:hypothetical protein
MRIKTDKSPAAIAMAKTIRAYLSTIGEIGGSKTSIRKTIASRKNGKKGGRPRKEKPSISFIPKSL